MSSVTRKIQALLVFVTLLCALPLAYAADDFLEPEVAFQFSAKMLDAKTAEVTYKIADGYYMYREHFKFRVEGAKLGTPIYVPGQIKFDETFQKNVEIYHHSVSVRLPLQGSGPFTLISTGQGCAEKGLCYPPLESKIKLTLPENAGVQGNADNPKQGGQGGDGGVKQAVAAPKVAATIVAPSGAVVTTVPSMNTAEVRTLPPVMPVAAPANAPQSEATKEFENALRGGKLLVILPLFFLGGLALSLTPCVLPMVPILSSIIVGEGSAVTRGRGFTLSVTYSLGMALVYTALGLAAGWAGEGLAASFQNPWVLGGFGLLIAFLALSMFDVYQLQMPAAIQLRLMKASDQQTAGKLAGVFVMGALSGLIIGPCVAAPLIGVLVVISQTHNAALGGSALFATAMGMSVPLLLVGLSAGWLVPRAGVWMEAIKRFFGVLLLGVALWMVSPVIPVMAQLLGWAALGVGYGSYLLFSKRWGGLSKAFGVAFALFGIVQLVGASTGANDVLAPLAGLTGKQEAKTAFVRVKSVAELDAALAKAPGKTAMLDFYADWCVSCKEMEKLTFSD
ncbi:MAG TPA: protein-disulfide reductase DsbD, partial [Burkholderiaceae bacterium]|nr:protein-disulfide reductase DsbD [Burkholderiaceae bacterium]